MKKCPTCDREFDDAMRFCQTDGTALVEAAPPVDPYKTMVAKPEDIAAAMPPASPAPGGSEGSGSEDKSEPSPDQGEDVLDIPESDPKKTMYASEDEIRSAMAEVDKPVVDLPPPPTSEPKPPPFIAGEEKVEAGDKGSSGVGQPEGMDAVAPKTTPPIPSPFGSPSQGSSSPISEPKREPFKAPEPEPPPFAKPEASAPKTPFSDPAPAEKAPVAQAEWTPPPAAQDKGRQDEKMQNPQYQQGGSAPAAGGQNKVLPIVSLVFGILSLCCYFAPLTGLIALITGFLGMKNANNDPANYGGKPLAIVGMVLGGLLFLAGIGYYVFLLFFGGMGMMMDMMNR